MDADEYEHIENKLSTSEWKEGVISIAAFATARGGVVRFGIHPTTRARVGIDIGKTTLENLANNIKDNTDPPQFPSITLDPDPGPPVINVSIEESPVKPVWAFGRPYKRVGRTNQRLSPAETSRLTEKTTGRTWDALPRPGMSLPMVEPVAIQGFLRRAEQDPAAGIEGVLENLGFINEQSISNAAVLLFAKDPQRYVPEAQVKCALFRGMTSIDFLDQQTINGTLLTQIEEALAFVARNTRQGISITGAASRENVSEYPLEAVREAVVNAICHRDYAAGGTTQIRIYEDRMEIWNPGMLPRELAVEDLFGEHSSHPRNPNVAAALYRARVMEHWGTGTLRIIEACERRGMPPPEFRSEQGRFIVRFRKTDLPFLVTESIHLNDRQRRAISYVQQHGSITTIQYQALVELSERTARRDLSALVEADILLREDQGPSTFYVLKDSRP